MRRIAVFVLCARAATAVAAPPQVEIRAQTKLALDKVRLVSDDQVEIRGQLLDNLTGAGIAGQLVTIRIGDQATTAMSDGDGGFVANLAVAGGPQQLELAFRGGAQLSASQLQQVTDPARAQVALTMEFEEAPGGVKVVVRATADDQPTELAAALSIGVPGHAPFAALGTARTGTPFLLTRKAAGGPGTRQVRAAFAGDDLRQGATVENTIELGAKSTTTMTVTATTIAYEDDLGVTGTVRDEDGHPIAGAAVTLAANDRRLARDTTSADGSFEFQVEGEILGAGSWGLQVQAEPGMPAVDPSRSTPRIVRVSAPQPVPVSYTVAAFLATACAAGGFFMARAKPWRRLRRRARPADLPASPVQDEAVPGGLVLARPGIVSTLRRASDDGFSGVVRDTVRGRPVGDAAVRMRLGSSEREARTGRDGAFAFDALEAGDWLAEASAPGHVTERFSVSLPHRGELRGVRVDLVPVRERVFQLYRRAAEPILPEPRLWGVWSPRQIVDHVRSKRPSPALADLTSFVEEIYFSSRLAGEAAVPVASEHVDRAIRERAHVAS